MVAENEAGVVGMAILSDTFIGQLMEMPAVQLTHLVVAEGQRRRGIGQALLAGAVTWAEEVGADEIVASVLPSLRDANRFYARLGFAPLVMRRVVPVATLRRNLALTDPRGARPRRRRSPLSVGGGLGLRSRLGYSDTSRSSSCPTDPSLPGATVSRTTQVSRAVQTRRPSSSVMTISYDASVPPRVMAVATPVMCHPSHGAVVTGVELDAHRDRPGPACRRRGERAQLLGEHARRAAVQHAVRLRVALDRHRADHPVGRDLQHLDAHPLAERPEGEVGCVGRGHVA